MSHKAVPINVPAHWSFGILPGIQLSGLMFFSPMQGPALYSFCLISLFASWRLFSDGRPYSLNKLWWTFCLIFFSIIPSITFMTPSGTPAGASVADTNLAIFICLALFEGMRLWASYYFVPQGEGSPPSVPGVLLRQYAHFAPAIVLCCGALLAVSFGVLNPVTEVKKSGSNWMLPALPLLRSTMLWCSITAIVLYRQHRLGVPLLLLVLIPSILFNLPIGMPPSFFLIFLLGWLLASGFFSARQTHLFSWLLIACFVLGAPAFEGQKTTMSPVDGSGWKIAGQEDLDRSPEWQGLSLCIEHDVKQSNVAGRQLMGAILFFVPNSVWPSKPEGSEMMLQKHFPAVPVSGCSLLGEGFLNFGIWGACFFVAVLALGIARYDGWYWRRGGHLRFTLPRLYYFVSFGLLFMLLHGDMQYAFLNGFVFLFGFTFWQSLFFWRITGPKYQLHY